VGMTNRNHPNVGGGGTVVQVNGAINPPTHEQKGGGHFTWGPTVCTFQGPGKGGRSPRGMVQVAHSLEIPGPRAGGGGTWGGRSFTFGGAEGSRSRTRLIGRGGAVGAAWGPGPHQGVLHKSAIDDRKSGLGAGGNSRLGGPGAVSQGGFPNSVWKSRHLPTGGGEPGSRRGAELTAGGGRPKGRSPHAFWEGGWDRARDQVGAGPHLGGTRGAGGFSRRKTKKNGFNTH